MEKQIKKLLEQDIEVKENLVSILKSLASQLDRIEDKIQDIYNK